MHDVDLPEVAFLPIECPKCGRTAESARDQMDPPEAVKAIILCPDCVGGDFGTTTYLDASGNELLPSPDGYQ
ncbi:MAG: hypothetical protein AAFU41_00815 [Pseudomonadota bacterium]